MRGLVKSYGPTPVLRGVDLTVDEHRVVTLIGASGSGKSTLLRCVDLLEEIDDGQVLLDGVDVADPRADVAAAQRRMGIVFQAFNLFPHMTALENVTLAPRVVHGVRAAEATARAHELLRRVGLADFAARAPRPALRRPAAAGGDRPRAGGAAAPAAARRDHLGARPRARRRGARDRARPGASGVTILMATHEMGFARQVADTVCFLDGGRVLESGPPGAGAGRPGAGADAAVPRPPRGRGRLGS